MTDDNESAAMLVDDAEKTVGAEEGERIGKDSETPSQDTTKSAMSRAIKVSPSGKIEIDREALRRGVAEEYARLERSIDSSESLVSRSASSFTDLLSGFSTPSSEAAEVARVASNTARKAATSCRKVSKATMEAISAGKNRVETALQRAEDSAEDDASYYRALATEYGKAVGSVSVKADNVETAAHAADVAADKAEEAARDLEGVQNERSPEMGDKIKLACWAANTANVAAIVAFKIEFLALRAMRKCWKHIDDVESTGSNESRERFIGGAECDVPRNNRCVKVLSIVAFILGIALVVSLGYLKYSEDAHKAVLFLGVVMMAWPVVYAVYLLCVCYRKKRLQAKVNQTRRIIADIDRRLEELSNYFENNSINPVSSDESDED